LMGVMLSSCAQSPEVKSAKYVAAGKALVGKKDFPRAILQFKNAIKATPDNAEVYFQLGEAYTAGKDLTQALGAYRKTLELDSKHSNARLRLAQMMASSNDPDTVKDALGQLHDLAKNAATNPEILNTLAFADMRLGNIDSAVDSLDRVLAESPADLGASALLAGAKLLNHDPKAAEEILIKACKESPRSADARRVLGDFYVEQKRMADAETQFQSALAIDPTSGKALLDLARLQIDQKRDQEADQNLRRLAKLDEYRSIHAVFLFQQGKRDEAILELEKLTKENPEDRAVRSNLVVAYRATGRSADADKVLARILKVNPKDADALLQRGEIAIAAKDYAVAEADLNQVLQLRPGEPEVHYLLAKLSETRGATLTYRQELNEALQLNPNLLAVRIELARSLLATTSGASPSAVASGAHAAIVLLDAAPPAQKNSQPLLIQRNWALWTLKDMAPLRQGIDLGLSRGRSPDLLIQFGLWKMHTGDPVGARALVEEALKIDPTDIRAMEALSQSYLAEKNADVALRKVKEYASQRPSSAAAQDFLGVMLMATGDKQQARVAFEAAKAADPQYAKSDLRLVQVDASESKFESARKRLDAVLAANANNTTARLWLGNIEITLGHNAAAIEHFRKVVLSNPENAQASNNLAYLLSEYANKPDEALKYAEKAVNVAPDKQIYSDTMGWTLYRKGLYAPAITYLERAAAGKSGDVVWKYHLAMAYAKAGDLDRGRVELEAALKINPNVPEAKTARQVLGLNP
jgi:tetratricopeptide (TPR) repeat protein